MATTKWKKIENDLAQNHFFYFGLPDPEILWTEISMTSQHLRDHSASLEQYWGATLISQLNSRCAHFALQIWFLGIVTVRSMWKKHCRLRAGCTLNTFQHNHLCNCFRTIHSMQFLSCPGGDPRGSASIIIQPVVPKCHMLTAVSERSAATNFGKTNVPVERGCPLAGTLPRPPHVSSWPSHSTSRRTA